MYGSERSLKMHPSKSDRQLIISKEKKISNWEVQEYDQEIVLQAPENKEIRKNDSE